MISYKIFPMYEFGPLHINLYGVMFAFGIFTAIYLAVKEAKKRNREKDTVYDLAFYLLTSGIIGARLFYVFFYWPKDIPLTFFDILKIWNGGLAFFGGFLGAVIAGYVYSKKKKLNFWMYADIFAIPLVVGHILGRVGDYLTGGHPGKEAQLPWAIYMDGASRHPVVLYEISGLVIIGIILFMLKNKKLFDGFLFLSYVVLYSIQRLFLDFFRIETTDPRYMDLTPSQFVVIIFLFFVIYFMMIQSKRLRVKKV